jgi:DNA-binding PadR family transcriptional regulator
MDTSTDVPTPPRQPLTLAVFTLLLALHQGERHGYALMTDVAELTGGTIVLGPATLYRSLQRMRVDGLVEEIDTGGAAAAQDRHIDRRSERRRSYRITAAGRATAATEARRLARLVNAATRLGLLIEGNET